MIQAARSFWAFTKTGYKIFVLIVAPVIYLALYVGLLSINLSMEFIAIVAMNIVIMLETLLDYMFMGGFYSKNNSSMEYLQSSNRFAKIIKDVVLVDMLRKSIIYVGGYGLLLFRLPVEVVMRGIWIPVFLLLLILITSFMERHFVSWYSAYGVALVVEGIGSIVIGISMLSSMTVKVDSISLIVGTVSLLLVTIGIMVGTYKYSMKKVRDSYYD